MYIKARSILGACVGFCVTLTVGCSPTIQDQPTGGAAATSTGGAAGTGGATPTCTPGANIPCYDGPAGTEGVGLCASGTKTCAADGATFGACVGQVTPKVEDCSTPADDDCKGSAPECGALSWVKQFGGADQPRPMSIATDPAGNVFLAGMFYGGTLDFGSGPFSPKPPAISEGFVAKFDPSGSPLWAKELAASNVAARVAVDGTGSVVVVGNLVTPLNLGGGTLAPSGDVDGFVAKLDADGKHVWSKKLGSMHASCGGVVVNAAGDIAVYGNFSGSMTVGGVTLSSAVDERFVVRFDPTGAVAFAKKFWHSGLLGSAFQIAMDSSGRMAISGGFASAVDFGGGALSPVGAEDVYVAMLDPKGQHLWTKSYGGPAGTYTTGASVAIDANGDVVIAGVLSGDASPDFGGGPLAPTQEDRVFVAKLAAMGGHLWSRAATGNFLPYPYVSATVDAVGNVVIAGASDPGSSIDFGGGPVGPGFIAELDPVGAHRWSRSASLLPPPPFNSDVGLSPVTTDPAGNVLVTGGFVGALDFVGTMLSSGGGNGDILLAKLAP